jgi:hypothetical protein
VLNLGRKLIHTLSGTADGRRAHPRRRTHLGAICRLVGHDREIAARVQEVSRGGIKLRLGETFREGTMVRIDLTRAGNEPPTMVLACVMHVQATTGGEWEVGCNFSLELSDEEVWAFGGPKARAGTVDQRGRVRLPARGTVVFQVLPGDDGPPRTAQLVNLSQAGLGLISDDPLEPGTALTVSLKRRHGRPDRSVVACVVYQSRGCDGRWEVGCNFLHELAEKELNELLGRSAV